MLEILFRIRNTMEKNKNNHIRKPDWMKVKLPSGKNYLSVRDIVEKNNLHTICTSGNCPNMGECWGKGTATLMILGDICTRSCKFCATKTGKPMLVDFNEPLRVAESVQKMKLKHCVITSVDRDDLEDGGAEIWEQTILEIKRMNPSTTIEALIPDFNGNSELITKIIKTRPEVISHNLETVKRLTPITRSRSKYETSLKVIQTIASSGTRSKSGIMLGLGETEEEIIETMRDLRKVGCQIMTLGQYLQPTKNHLDVVEFISPLQFKKYEETGIKLGFRFVESGPLVRSSYCAEKHLL